MGKFDKNLLEDRINQFCDSSIELLTDIHAKQATAKQGKSKRKKKAKQTDLVSMPDMDTDMDYHEDAP